MKGGTGALRGMPEIRDPGEHIFNYTKTPGHHPATHDLPHPYSNPAQGAGGHTSALPGSSLTAVLHTGSGFSPPQPANL